MTKDAVMNDTSVQVIPGTEYVATIGIECHVQLKTKTKLFSGADNDARDAKPNTTVSPICFGLPGVLPVLNKRAVELAVRAGVALHAEIAEISSFDRKHYFYPDLPKGYQITQLERPIVGRGHVDVPGDASFRVGITRAHLEEDAGKLTHPGGADYSLVDLNRAGTPLLEIVSEPDMHTPAQAKAYAQELYILMKQAAVTDGDLYHGNMRFDVNISVAPVNADAYGTRVEVKNLNSFRSVERAAEYELQRQLKVIEQGSEVTQETRGWDDAKQKTLSQRSKEEAQDYRYFPDADIPPVHITKQFINTIRRDVEAVLPSAIRSRLTERGIAAKTIATLLRYPLLLERVQQIADQADDNELKLASDLLVNVLPGRIDESGRADDELRASALTPSDNLLSLIRLQADKTISSSSAKILLADLWQTFGGDIRAIATRRGMVQSIDESAIALVVDEVMADPASQKAIADVRSGNDRAIGYLVGQVMKKSGGAISPNIASDMVKRKIG